MTKYFFLIPILEYLGNYSLQVMALSISPHFQAILQTHQSTAYQCFKYKSLPYHVTFLLFYWFIIAHLISEFQISHSSNLQPVQVFSFLLFLYCCITSESQISYCSTHHLFLGLVYIVQRAQTLMLSNFIYLFFCAFFSSLKWMWKRIFLELTFSWTFLFTEIFFSINVHRGLIILLLYEATYLFIRCIDTKYAIQIYWYRMSFKNFVM